MYYVLNSFVHWHFWSWNILKYMFYCCMHVSEKCLTIFLYIFCKLSKLFVKNETHDLMNKSLTIYMIIIFIFFSINFSISLNVVKLLLDYHFFFHTRMHTLHTLWNFIQGDSDFKSFEYLINCECGTLN